MGYAVKEIFFTLQGEGAHTGRAAVFLRFAGCNLWSGRQADRGRGAGGCSAWCDTDFVGIDGEGGGRFDDAATLAAAVARAWTPAKDARGQRFVVCTGGEPLLQLDEPLIDALHAHAFIVAAETNGTQPAPRGLDWVCVSPKARAPLVLTTGDELKLVQPQEGLVPEQVAHLSFTHFFLQPKDGPDVADNTRLVVDYCRQHPQWRVSLQTHKLLQIP
ncbi:MAG: 7-carboxy-7-deazaguanine synthase [Deltaproteobacteria bacterium]|nr:7-carboxy-7-deazaguanine synthase [Deltaproteobacteria bacterium]